IELDAGAEVVELPGLGAADVAAPFVEPVGILKPGVGPELDRPVTAPPGLCLNQLAEAAAEASAAGPACDVEVLQLRRAVVHGEAGAPFDAAILLAHPESAGPLGEGARRPPQLRHLAVHVEHAAGVFGEDVSD